MARKKVNGLQDDALLAVAILGGGYLLLRHSIPDLFGGADPQAKEILDDQQSQPQSIFTTQQEDYNDWFVSDGGAVDMFPTLGVNTSTDFYATLYRQFRDGDLSPSNQMYEIMLIYDQLQTALLGHLYSGDQDAAINALNMFSNKWQVGAVAECFADINGVTFWKALRYGSFPMAYGLNPTDLANQVTRLNNLPD